MLPVLESNLAQLGSCSTRNVSVSLSESAEDGEKRYSAPWMIDVAAVPVMVGEEFGAGADRRGGGWATGSVTWIAAVPPSLPPPHADNARVKTSEDLVDHRSIRVLPSRRTLARVIPEER
jgi:hypothetical protein